MEPQDLRQVSMLLLEDAKENVKDLKQRLMRCDPRERGVIQAELNEAQRLLKEARKYA